MLKKQLISGTVWSILGVFGTMIINLSTNIWLASMLSPKEFGQLGIVMFFIVLSNVLVEGGLSGALIRKKEPTSDDYSTVFICNLIVSFCCFLFVIFFSKYLAFFYRDSSLRSLLICSSFIIIIQAFQLSLNAKMIVKMRFKQRHFYRLISVLLSSIFAIYFAYNGAGVWSLIIQQLLNAFINTILLLLFEKSESFHKFRFSRTSFNELYGFGVNTTLSSILSTTFDNINQLILGKYFAIVQVGFFYQAKKIQDIPGGIINMLVQSVFFSSLAKIQNDIKEFTRIYNKITRFLLVFLGLANCIVFIYSESFILLLYGQKWIGIVFYMKLLTLASFFYYQELINRIIFKVFNKTKQILYLELIKILLQSISIFFGIYYRNIELLLVGFSINSIISFFISYYYSRRILSSTSYLDFFALIKTFFIGVLIAYVTISIFKFYNVTFFHTFFYLPILLFIYFLLIKILNVMNIKKEILSIYGNY